jgi:hypothetical protein
MNRSNIRQVLECASPLALWLAAVLTLAIPAGGQSPPFERWVHDVMAAVRAAQLAPAQAITVWDDLEKHHPLPGDWIQQDFPPQAWDWLRNPDPATITKTIDKIDNELHGAGMPSTARSRPAAAPDTAALLREYFALCQERRTARLKTLAAHGGQIVFTKHYNLGGSHYAYTEGQSDAQAERHFYPGSSLCRLVYDSRRSPADCLVETLLSDPGGVIRDPDVSYDGRRVLFAWKKSDRADDYHLYEMDLATRQARPITQGLGVADYEGVYLPDGDILFNSTRCVQIVDCWWTEVSNLYRCDKDGQFLRRVTVDQVHDNYPTVTEDGRILYTRWEYNDRSQIYPQPLLQMMPDGTGQTEFYGGNSWFPTSILHARGVPGTAKALAIASGHHTRQAGKLILLDPNRGRQENEGAQLVAPVRATKADRIDAYGQTGELFQYPYPISEAEFLVTYHPRGWREGKGWNFWPRFGIYLMRLDGRRELLVSDPDLPCNQPIPIRPRRIPFQRPNLVDYRKTEGTLYVQDVYLGSAMHGVPRGTIKKLRVVALDFRPAGIGSNGNGGPGGAALISTPVAIGNGAWDPKTILGDATVRDDGSVFCIVPTHQAIYFQLLDAKDRMVQSMRSWTSLQPGENATCVGCHENKNSAPPVTPRQTLAIRAGAETLQPFYGPPRGFSFTREIQPILDRHCVACHDGKSLNNYDLTAQEVADNGAKRRWLQSYLALTHAVPERRNTPEPINWRGNPDHRLLNWISAASVPTGLPPYSAGANRSRLIELLDRGHQNVALSTDSLDRLAAWIDLGVPFCGDYVEANTWNAAETAKYQHYLEKRTRLEAEEHRAIQALVP